MSNTKLFLLTAVAMVMFALNSLLCRLAFNETEIDQNSFTALRLLSGALFMLLIHQSRSADNKLAGNWWSSFALFVYAAGFSFAYVHLDAATGALLLFGAVQLSLIIYGVKQGERPNKVQLMGLTVAASGVVMLILPGATSPPWIASILMIVAGIAWAVYTLRGKQEVSPAAATKGNFVRTIPMLVILLLVMHQELHWDSQGAIYALVSGALASGFGYMIWYKALPYHTAISAAVVQLTVPPITAFGGVFLLKEHMPLNLIVLSFIILGGVGLFILFKRHA
ncbi:DMT family transporter [Alteromonas sediminis]|uniref:DMT family transporter n=1 Tax=Alteromonas sediminis TaxID=2259342 RepID=A0A3N5Y0E8_9ALTE|nr:DMT family transporter [Alteromonas sediminis]RPJ66540.1 DMT family transporter [Alteromonas sediminis]